MGVKNIISGVIMMVVALLIFSYLINSSIPYKIKNLFSDVESDVKTKVEEIPTPKKIACEEKAIELLPTYFFRRNYLHTTIDPYRYNPPKKYNYWNDGKLMFEPQPFMQDAFSIRVGDKEGENINYYYVDGHIRYSNKIIDKNGYVLGTTSFLLLDLILKPHKNNFMIDHSISFFNETKIRPTWSNPNEGYEVSRLLINVSFNWSGFDEEIKEIYNITELNVTFLRNGVLCEFMIESENGTNECVVALTDFQHIISAKFLASEVMDAVMKESEPYFYSFVHANDVYDIIDYKIGNCTWIGEN